MLENNRVSKVKLSKHQYLPLAIDYLQHLQSNFCLFSTHLIGINEQNTSDAKKNISSVLSMKIRNLKMA